MLRIIQEKPDSRNNPNILSKHDLITGFSRGKGMPLSRVMNDLIDPAYERLTQGETPSRGLVRLARKLSAEIMGLSHNTTPSLFTANNVKISKSNKLKKDLSYVLHLAPSKLSGFNTCPSASLGCIKACLNTSGHGSYSSTQASRVRKTRLMFKYKPLFGLLLYAEIDKLLRSATRKGLGLSLRLNGTSDIQWERVYPWVFTLFPSVQFYDYTKISERLGDTRIPSNYHLTLSRTESNDQACIDALNRGFNVAVVFSSLPDTWKGFPVLDGTVDDRRYVDPKGHIVGLLPLAKALKDSSGFVVSTHD